MTHYQNILLCILIAFVVAGCSNKVKVHGTVLFEDDGSPLTIGVVLLQNDTYSAKGQIQADGSFQISSVKKNDGVPPGVYSVAIIGAVKPPDSVEVPPGMDAMESAAFIAAERKRLNVSDTPIPLIPSKYMNPKDSGIVFDTSKEKVLNIKVERPSK